MRAASQLPGRGPTVVDMALYMHVNQKSDDDDDDGSMCLLSYHSNSKIQQPICGFSCSTLGMAMACSVCARFRIPFYPILLFSLFISLKDVLNPKQSKLTD